MGDRPTNAPYTVHHDGGTTTVQVNQRVNGASWNLLGSFDLTPGAGHKVVLSDAGNGVTIADALRFVPEPGGLIPRKVAADAVRFVSNDAEAPLYVHADHLGTPQRMTDQAAALVWDRVQRPFGETASLTGSAANPQRFPGQLHDPETGFHYNYFRDYDPTTGRYIQSDPIGLEGGVNTFAYVLGNPLYYFDRYGLQPIPFREALILLLDDNGNAWGDYTPQDGICTEPADVLEQWSCTRNCCQEHDACFAKYKCNYSSWLGNILGAGRSCQYCNWNAVICVVPNIGDDSCPDGDCEDESE